MRYEQLSLWGCLPRRASVTRIRHRKLWLLALSLSSAFLHGSLSLRRRNGSALSGRRCRGGGGGTLAIPDYWLPGTQCRTLWRAFPVRFAPEHFCLFHHLYCPGRPGGGRSTDAGQPEENLSPDPAFLSLASTTQSSAAREMAGNF